MFIHRGKPKVFVSEGLSPPANAGACLSSTRREAKKPPAAPVVSHFSRILGWGCAPFLGFGFLSLTPAAHLCPPGPGRVGAEHMFG